MCLSTQRGVHIEHHRIVTSEKPLFVCVLPNPATMPSFAYCYTYKGVAAFFRFVALRPSATSSSATATECMCVCVRAAATLRMRVRECAARELIRIYGHVVF